MIGPDRDIPAPDLGTDEQVMSWVMDTYSQHKGHTVPGVVTGKPIELGGSYGRREATGRGVISCAVDACRHLGLAFEGARVVVQGYGAVGATAARIAADARRAGDRGVRREVRRREPARSRSRARRRLACASTASLEGFPDAEGVSNADLLELPCEILIPAAIQNQITEKNADRIHCRLLVEGANGPTSLEADAILARRGIFVVPDILANAGGVTVSYFEWVQGLQHFLWTEQEVNNRLIELMQQAFREVLAVAIAQAHRHAHGGPDARHRPHHRSQAAARDLSLIHGALRLQLQVSRSSSSVAIPRNEKKPKTSVKVVTITPAPSAGSSRSAWSSSGTAAPARPATPSVTIIASTSASPSQGSPCQSQAKPALTAPVTSADHQPHRQLLAHRAQARRELDLAERDAAGDDGDGLDAAVAAHAGDHGHEDGQRHHLLERALEQAHHPGRQEAGAEVREHPGQAPAHRQQRGREDAVLLGEPREQVHVLGRFLVDHVDHVVDGDHAEHAAFRVGHGNREQVVARDQLRGLLLVGVGARRSRDP